MRLSRAERDAIAAAAKAAFPAGTCVRLFGSRIDDQRRGGDIDLLVETPDTLAPDEWIARRSRFTTQLYRALDEQRIDIVNAPLDKPDERPVVQIARADGIELVRT